MHEHVGDNLPGIKIGSREIVQTEPFVEITRPERKRNGCDKNKKINNEQIFYPFWQNIESPYSNLIIHSSKRSVTMAFVPPVFNFERKSTKNMSIFVGIFFYISPAWNTS